MMLTGGIEDADGRLYPGGNGVPLATGLMMIGAAGAATTGTTAVRSLQTMAARVNWAAKALSRILLRTRIGFLKAASASHLSALQPWRLTSTWATTA